MSWRLSGNLKVIAADIKLHFSPDPTIYSLGDSSHAARTSDHNPDSRGVVCAIDVMYSVGTKASAVVKACVGRSDLSYVIHNRTIWSAAYGWKARRYTGTDPHTNHVHVSSKHTSAADKTRTHLKWATSAPSIGGGQTAPAFPGTLKKGSKGTAVRTLQTRLNARGYKPALKVDGDFGASTVTQVKAFQKFAKLKQDGIVGPQTWRALWQIKIT